MSDDADSERGLGSDKWNKAVYLGCECAAPPPHGMLGSDAAAMRLSAGGGVSAQISTRDEKRRLTAARAREGFL